MDLKTTTTFLTRAQLKLRPQCIYWSLTTNELLVGMCKKKIEYVELSEESEKIRDYTWTGGVTRFNETGKLTQIIYRGDTGSGLFKYPCKITENNNGDIVVSDWSTAVVVTDREGRHRFSYTGHPPGSKLQPRGICTDALSHILVCDDETETVQLLDKDGKFLLHLLIRPPGIIRPHNLNYDVATHRLWVGSEDINKVLVYKYITRQDAVIDQYQTTTIMESPNENLTQETETPQDRNECLLQLMSSPELQRSFTQTDDPNWTPRSVYWSPSGGDLLVGLGKANPETGKVSRYNRTGQQTQPRQHNNSDQEIYKDPKIITENNNGDIVVSDFDAVVVTERGGRHRFSYTGHPPGSPLKPRGVCTDAMSHILVCDNRSRTVHMLDENGQFLSYLLPKSQEMGVPSSLSYDANTHRLWLAAGSYKKYKVFVYKYMTLKDPPTGML
uniref:Tripartite motif-containing protein 3 n=1 Tax=Magallana gigas TaxID=29159 RepID=K1R8V0_MAGGI